MNSIHLRAPNIRSTGALCRGDSLASGIYSSIIKGILFNSIPFAPLGVELLSSIIVLSN